MGMNADLLAIGPFDEDIVKYLDYGPWCYKGIEAGQKVVTTLITCRTSESSESLARALGFGSMDLGQHVMAGLSEAQRKNLVRFMLVDDGVTAADCHVEAVDALSRRAGWTFIYRPNA